MDYNKRRKLIIIGLIVFIVLFIGAIVWAIIAGGGREGDGTEEPEITVTTDPDTGDEIVDVPGKSPEFEISDKPTVLGGSQLIDNTTMSFTQYDLIVETVGNYAKERVGDITTIKFLPETIKELATTPAGEPYQYGVQVKTVDPEVILDITINLIGLDRVRLNITNTNDPGQGTYDSGIVPDASAEEEGFDEGL